MIARSISSNLEQESGAYTTMPNRAMPKRILVVDDDSAVREVVALLLSHRGFEPMLAASAEDGIEQLQKKPDLLITDLSLQGRLSGIDLIQFVRDDAEFHDIPIIAMSGSGGEDAKAAIRAGANKEVRKPHLGSLVNLIDQLLSASSSSKKKREDQQ